MRGPAGYFVRFDPDPPKGEAATFEADTFTCQHCGNLNRVKPMCDPADIGGLCKQCMGLVCARCYGKGTCDPLEEKLRRSEDRARFGREFDALSGT